MARNFWALLPCTMIQFNKKKVELARITEVWEKSTVYICTRVKGDGKASIVFLVSCGRLANAAVGDLRDGRHDQTHADLGDFTVLNIADMQGGKVVKSDNRFGLQEKAPVMVFK